MRFSLFLTFCRMEEYIPLTLAAEECSWDSINMGDGLFFYDTLSVNYPYTETGERYWTGETNFPDPFSMCSALAVLTQRIKLFINVLKTPVRNPMLVAKAAGTLAGLSNDRMVLGIGMSPWPEDYQICGQQWKQRGLRCEEQIEILRKALTGEMFEHHGKFYDIPRVQISPVGKKLPQIVIGGMVDAVYKRAARIADGFTAANLPFEATVPQIQAVNRYRKEFGTDAKPFEMIACATDLADVAGHQRLEELGATQQSVCPWLLYGGSYLSPLQFKLDALRRFTDEVVSRMK